MSNNLRETPICYYCDTPAEALELVTHISEMFPPQAVFHAMVSTNKDGVWQVVCDPTPESDWAEDLGSPQDNSAIRAILLAKIEQMLANETNRRRLAASQSVDSPLYDRTNI